MMLRSPRTSRIFDDEDHLMMMGQYHDELGLGSSDDMNEIRLSNSADDHDNDVVVHDQLPAVDEIHVDHALSMNRLERKGDYIKWCIMGVVAGVVVVLFLFVGSSSSNENEATNYQPTQGDPTLKLDRETAARNYLGEISQLAVLQGSYDTPQYDALQWILHDDALNLDVPDRGDLDAPFLQRYIVAVFVYAVGSDYMEQFHFLSERHECEWNSSWERTDGQTIKMGIMCDHNNSVNAIVMQTVGLTGTLPSELYYLKHLKTLALDVNHLSGDIPIIPSLDTLSLSFNSYEGSLPHVLSSAPNLKVLDLSENSFVDNLPQMDGMINLQVLNLQGNRLTGKLHNVWEIPNLEEVNLSLNKFQGDLSSEKLGNQPNLRVIDASNNRLAGPIPDSLWALPSLQAVDFHGNALDGYIPNIPNSLPMKYFDISENLFVGSIPETINKLDKLTFLDVSDNRFEEKLPPQMGSLTALETLLLSDNTYFGPEPIPDWLREMKNLKHLSLKSTARTGVIPDWLFELKHLEILDMDWNHIAGTVPEKFTDLKHLTHLMLNRNLLTGTVPGKLKHMSNLSVLLVDKNQFNGTIDMCDLSVLIADCGDESEGCPDCDSDSKEVDCPCCTSCCIDFDETCNTHDWIADIQDTWEKYDQTPYPFNSKDEFKPVS